jgi:FkbM family methyltransferase
MSMTENRNTGMIFYGAGAFAKKHINGIISMGFVPMCFADEDEGKHYKKVETHYGNFEILPLNEAILRYPDCEIIVTVARLSFTKVCGDLMEKGVELNRISPSPYYGDIKSSVSLMQNMIRTGAVRKVEVYDDYTEFTVDVLNKNCIKLCGNNSTYAILGSGNYEFEEMQVSSRILSKFPENAVVFDIGANIGYYSLCVKSLFPKMEVHAFEPSTSTFNALMKNIDLNNLDGIIANSFGLYNEEKVVELFAPEKVCGHTSLKNILRVKECQKEKCKVTTLDSYIEKSGIHRIDFIKCDVEGAELFVYEGGRKTLEKFKPVVLSEILHSEAFGYKNDDVLSFFAQLGYECFRICGDDLIPVDKVSKEYGKNYLFVHSLKFDSVI